MNRQEMLDLLDDLDVQLTSANGDWVDPILPAEGNNDTPEDLSDSELQTLINQLHTKIKRPRRPVGDV